MLDINESPDDEVLPDDILVFLLDVEKIVDDVTDPDPDLCL